MSDQKTAGSASKTDEQAAAQSKARTNREAQASAGKVELEHGEAPKQEKAPERDAWGDTPLQMRDQHDPAVDPTKKDEAPGRSEKVSPMEPGQTGEDAPKGGTNAPA